MNIWNFRRVILFLFLVSPAATQGLGATNEATISKLDQVASRVLREGKDSTLNGGFARVLGLSKDGSAIPMKVVVSEAGGITNRFWVGSRDTNTVVIGSQQGSLVTYYATDVSGRLKSAVVNDGSIKQGGMTNIPAAQALKKFEEQKKWWVLSGL